MMKNITAFITLMFLGVGILGAQTSLEGKVIDAETNEPIIFGNVALYKNGVLITGTETDFDGNYSFSNIDPGTYDVEATYVGYQAQRQVNVIVLAGKAVKLDFMVSSGVLIDEIEIVDYKVPLIEQDNTTTGGVVTAEKIRNLPTKSINALAATTAGLSSIDGGAISIRGSRSNATDYYIDGVRVSGSLIPQSEIDQLQVITGGIEAQYGDVTGGIISITTKGPSSRFSGGLEIETSEVVDPYGYNLISGNFSGPLLKNAEGRSVLGFRISGQYLNRQDDGPSAYGRYRASEDIINQLEANPLNVVSGSLLNSAEFINDSDVALEEARPNSENKRLDLTAKLDARLSNNVDITFSGNYNNNENIFSPSEAWALFNWRNNPIASGHSYRGNFRFRHRLGGAGPADAAARAAGAKSSLIRNAQYTLQFGYQKGFNETMDIRHGANLFDYGYVGNFENAWMPAAGESIWSGAVQVGNTFVAHAGYVQQFNGWTPGSQNAVRARYNDLQEGVPEMTQYNAYNGFLSGNYSSTWSGLHTNVGSVYNTYGNGESDRYTFSATSSFDLFPGGSNKGRHNIQFGIIYEQRIGRSWNVAPAGLWTIARLQANAQIIGIDTMNVIGTFSDTLQDGTVIEFDQFQTLLNDDSDLLFFRKVRELTGQTINDYVNIDGLDPSQLSLDMFSAQELNDQRILGYYGYDYLGNKISNDVTFDDFFTDFDEEGRRKFTVAPTKPIYTAAYIQDKFTFKDIIFRLGLRVDRYDANTKVMKDPLTLYPIMNAGDFFDGPGNGEPEVLNIEDDWSVYVETEGSTKVRAFRDGEQWYDAEGSPVNDGNVIFGGELVNPFYVEQDNTRRNIRSRDFDPSGTFEDYTPQISYMPRMAFSFPISDEANFFAHYDILVQRPPSSSLATAMSYYYFEDGPPQNNPNLKPERTIDYEVGFKQKLSNSSAITLSAYYKEMRDMIQARTFIFVPPPVNQYESFGNIDFGTVKGFSVSYDLRRTNNLELTASYTLQFADGTGSNANSQRGLTSRGNLRTLFPLSFDERHRLVANLDYRYGSGRSYNGPRLFGADIFANTGVGLQITGVSGRPYSKRIKPTQFGGTGLVGAINGARLPWNFTLDLRANKQFRLQTGSEEDSRGLFVNVYVRVQNLLDTKNIIGVYSASGSAEDSGYINSSDGQGALNTLGNSGRDVDAFLTSYQWRLLNPGFYTLPRRINVGAIVEF